MTAREIERAKPGSILWDDQVRGLHVRTFDTKRVFYLKYRTKARQQRRPKLGDYGVLSLTAARDIARYRLSIVAKGGDPDADVARHTVKDLKRRFMEDHALKRKAKTQEMYESAWIHILKHMGSVPVSEVTRKEVVDLHHALRNKPVMANRTIAVLRKAMNLAEAWGWRPIRSNPVWQIEMNKELKRRRKPSLEEAISLIRTLDKFDHPIFVGYIWMLVMTGCRPNEIRTAKREWIQPDGLHLPDTKTGERIIPLSTPARAVVAAIPTIKGNPYLIPGYNDNAPLVGTQKLWDRVLATAKIENLQMRDLRRYFASLGLSEGLTLETVGQLLGHTQAQTTKVYAYLLTDAATKASETTAAALVRIRRKARGRRSSHTEA